MLKRFKKTVFYIVSFYIALGLMLFLLQRNIIYQPTKFESYNESNLKRLNVSVLKQDNLEWLYLPAYQKAGRKVLIYFHGNGGAAIDRIDKAELWRRGGVEVILAEYPGYGTNGGSPSEKEFYRSARVIIDRALADHPEAELYLYGESIGSGTAVQMATEYKEKALIIEVGFSSLTSVAQTHYFYLPVSLLLKDRFDNLSKINRINSDLYMFHGLNDEVVPFDEAKRLFAAYKGQKQFYPSSDARHNNIYQHMNMKKIISHILSQ